MRRSILVLLPFAFALFALLALNVKYSRAEAQQPNSARATNDPTADPVTPMNQPDKFAWMLFVYINRKPDEQVAFGFRGDQFVANDAWWETWASNDLTFPPQPDPSHPPVWPGTLAQRAASRMQLRLRSKVEGTRQFGLSSGDFVADSNTKEIVLRNKPSFDFIISNNLWYSQGLAGAFRDKKNISFPTPSIEIKADWTKIAETDKPLYHWNYDKEGQLWGLVGFHITTKTLPNWFWATFEWNGNPGRSDYIGSHDAFGAVPHDQAPSTTIGTVYPSGALTPELLQIFEDGGLTGEWGDEWKNYRLKGSQTAFTDAIGNPTLLGNSVIEKGFVQTASCITCHARAAVGSDGSTTFEVAGFRPSLPGVGRESFNGTPDPSWFYRNNTDV